MATALARALCQTAGIAKQQTSPLQQKQHAALSQHYAELNRTYEALKQEYATLRLPVADFMFRVTHCS